jgi:hypothetical protein
MENQRQHMRNAIARRIVNSLTLALLLVPCLVSAEELEAVERDYITAPPAPSFQTLQDADSKSAGCVSCHSDSDQKTMHRTPAVILGCTDCHGGNPLVMAPAGEAYRAPRHADGHTSTAHGDSSHGGDHGDEHGHDAPKGWSSGYQASMDAAHVLPRYPGNWHGSANPAGSYANLNIESSEFIRFINPGDLRVARDACGACHLPIIQASERSLMATSAMLWGGASYNNGILPYKRYILGESYSRESEGGTIKTMGEVTPEMAKRGVLAQLYPLPTWASIPPADIFRVFERGGRNINSTFAEVGLPNSLGQIQRLEEPGRPDIKQSNRGGGTGARIAVPVINITKTRLNDPHLWFLGTNDNPGDFRSSGCTSCHVVYANDRDPRHSAIYAQFGNFGESQQIDPTIPMGQKGHPLKHEFTRAIPTSQCMICHMHQPNMFINTMLGYIMWDYESDAPSMWPSEQRYPSNDEMREILDRNPEEAAIRGNWSDLNFLKDVSLLNPTLKDTQFADYHGHGWNFRAIFKRDRKGNLLDAAGEQVAADDPEKFQKAVHMSSIHVDVGMQCVDCHFSQDAHGNGHVVGEVMAGVEIQCQDCHGTADAYPNLRTTGPMASKVGRNLKLIRNPDGRKRFEWINGELIQRSAVTPGLEWKISLVKDTADPVSPAYNALATRAHTVSNDTSTLAFGTDVPKDQRAHGEDKMLCYTCHTSWTTSCGGCHLPIQANWKTKKNHYEPDYTRNYATYNPQVTRDDMFQLGIHGEVKDHKIAPVRSSSALILSSTNANRERIYIQQPPVSASGFSSQAFAPHYPHTERRTETKTCTDCHLSKQNDNNAIMAQLMLQGTKFVDFIGFNAWVGGGAGVHGIRVTEWEEPQAVVGSYLHRYAYPDWYAEHEKHDRVLQEGYAHKGGAASCVQLRGEYLYSAEGAKGLRVYDVASIANKGISQRIITAPASKLGQDTNIRSTNATCVVLPTTQPIYPDRNQGDLIRKTNMEQPFHPVYNYAFVTDASEGLILTDVNTLQDGEPRNNFLERALTWNAGGVLNGARHLSIAGTWFYVAADAGLVVLDMNDPLQPRHVATLPLPDVRASQQQFRYLFVTTRDGLQTVDVTSPEQPRIVDGALVPLKQARKLHIARTFAYVANGGEGLAIVDITKPEAPALYQMFDGGGAVTDAHDVAVGATNASLFAYIADGTGGLKVVQLFSPETQPNFYGFSPDVKPQVIASYPTADTALSVSRGLERDRAVDETGHQIAVLGRVGSRPFTLEEMQKLYLDDEGRPWFVDDQVEGAKGIATEPAPWLPNTPWERQPARVRDGTAPDAPHPP